MKLRDLCELAGRNLRESLLRNSLTTLGIAVGVASLVAMLSLGIGLQQLAMRRLERTGLFDSVLVRTRQLGGPNGGARQRLGLNAQPQSIKRSMKTHGNKSRNCPAFSKSILRCDSTPKPISRQRNQACRRGSVPTGKSQRGRSRRCRAEAVPPPRAG